MALIRCKDHMIINGHKHQYVEALEPIGYPDTSSICGKAKCNNPGLVLVRPDELDDFLINGQRYFYTHTYAVCTKVKDKK